MTLVNIGGRDPHVIGVDAEGRRVNARGARTCSVGIGSFLMFTARHLDVSPTRLQELAAAADKPVAVSSYCSVFSNTEVLERLREGATREQIALGSMHSIAERILEIGGFDAPVYVCGGVAEYFPGVLRALETLSGVKVGTVPDPIFTGALGAALQVLRQPAALTEGVAP
jgi:activator of 2-hydroxyglutaryl-CoA dehydratase